MNITLLLQALKVGECTWVSMTAQEINDLKAELKDKLAKKRASRSDIGGTHKKFNKCKQNDENVEVRDEEERPTKRNKGKGKAKGQLPPLVRSWNINNGTTSEGDSSCDSE
jgi:hypothetical protein